VEPAARKGRHVLSLCYIHTVFRFSVQLAAVAQGLGDAEPPCAQPLQPGCNTRSKSGLSNHLTSNLYPFQTASPNLLQMSSKHLRLRSFLNSFPALPLRALSSSSSSPPIQACTVVQRFPLVPPAPSSVEIQYKALASARERHSLKPFPPQWSNVPPKNQTLEVADFIKSGAPAAGALTVPRD
jgi:hypothetical protein